MKKLIAMLLVLAMAVSLVACGENNKPTETTIPTVAPTNPTDPAGEGEGEGEGDITEPEGPVYDPNTAAGVLNNIYNAYNENDKPMVSGGTATNPVFGGPGAIPADDAETLSYNLLVPADQIASITDAASLIFAMNGNSMTVGAFQVTGDKAAFAEAMRNAVLNNTWMCGFPEKVVIFDVDGYVVMFFGLAGVVDPEFGNFLTPFTTALKAAYPNATVISEDVIG